ncbi:MAG: glycosyltransferase family 2 protein [Phycisphaeraceae bacterium]
MCTLIAIPVYNEEKYVAKVLTEVRRYAHDILVIDDGSTDQTPLLLAQQPVDVIRHKQNHGYGRSLIDAFRWAACTTCKYQWLITMDCDEQHEPASLPSFYEAIQHDDADIISGSRYLATNGNGDANQGSSSIGSPPADRRAINATITDTINRTLGLSLTDAFCGYKAYRVSAIRKLTLNEPGYAFPLQFWVQAAAADLRIREIPIRLIYNDPNRSFGGPLDDAEIRLGHYKEVFERELAKFPGRFEPAVAVK